MSWRRSIFFVFLLVISIFFSISCSSSATNTNQGLNPTSANLIAPSNLVYSANPAVYLKDVLIPDNKPSNSGGTITSYSTSKLPLGLTLDPITGVISGTPLLASVTANYTIVGSNSDGTTSALIAIGVDESQALSNFIYTTNPAIYTIGVPITDNKPLNSGSLITGYTSSALPSGLILNPLTGIISGTPLAVSDAKNYTVTALNSSGLTVNLTITIIDEAPTNLIYSANPASYTKGVSISENKPSNAGGKITNYSANLLPTGLTINPLTGVISGTPSLVSAVSNYTITASNSGGSSSVEVSILVNDQAPSGLTYSTNPANYTVGVPIPENKPSSSGGIINSYTASKLPSGLTINPLTGVISGTPTLVSAFESYTITASNSGGTTSVNITISSKDQAPSSLVYSANPAIYIKNVSISANKPSNSGGTITSYSTSNLPLGLILDPITGVISGTPLLVSVSTNYTVVASNSGGTVNTIIAIAVNDVDGQVPSNFIYSANPAIYTVGVPISENKPLNSGSLITGYTSSALPSGLILNPLTGIISGTPLAVSDAKNYTVTALNSSGLTVNLTFTIIDEAPTNLTYSANPASYTKGVSISENKPSNAGGKITNYSANLLPTGLTINPLTGVISGTPSLVSAVSNYTITASNSGGSSSVEVSILINDQAPSGLTYSTNPANYTVGVPIPENNPSSSGGVITSYTASILPSGLTINSLTGVITGTPLFKMSVTNITITATNSGGSISTVISFLINYKPTWNEYLGSHYSNRIWNNAIREPAGTSKGGFVTADALIPVTDTNGNITTKDLNDFKTLYLPSIASSIANNILVLQFGGLGSSKDSAAGLQRVIEFMDLVQSNVSIYRNALYERAKSVSQLGYIDNFYWQIGNEISATSYSKNLHLWANDGLIAKDSDTTIIPMFVEYFLAPGVEGVEQASLEVLGATGKIHLMLGSIVGAGSTKKQLFLDALLDYTVVGTYAPSLTGKKVKDLLDSVSIHYTIATNNWSPYFDNFVTSRMQTTDRLRNIFSTEEIGNSASSSGNAMGTVAKILSRYLEWWEKQGWDHHRGHLFLYAPDSNGLDTNGNTVANTSAGYFLENLNNLFANEILSIDTLSPTLSINNGDIEWYSFRSRNEFLLGSFFAGPSGQGLPATFSFTYNLAKAPEVTIIYLTYMSLTQVSIMATPLGAKQYQIDLSIYNLTSSDGVIVIIK